MNDTHFSETVETDWRRLLTPEERSQMLGDIARVSLAAGASLYPEQSWQNIGVAVGSRAARKSPVERLAFMERALTGLTQAVRQISRFPLRRNLSQTRPVTPPIRARRVSAQAVLQSVRRGPSVRRWDETVAVQTWDTPENRAVKAFLQMLQNDCTGITQMAEAEEEREAAERAGECLRQLRELVQEEWWQEVTLDGLAWTKPPTPRAIARPEYAQAFGEMTRYRKDFAFDESQALLTLPPRETWRLYETWCLFRVLDGLMALDYTPTAGTDALTVREGRLTWMPVQGEPSRIPLKGPQGRRLSLIYNQTFAQGKQSLSRTMQPDILVEDTVSGKLWILDAKFKAYALPGEENGDINQMHAYRDAILGQRGERSVAHAWCLYAGLADMPNRERIAYGAEKGLVGALCLRPGSEALFSSLCHLLLEWLTAKPPP